MLSVSTLSELTTQCATRYHGPRTHKPILAPPIKIVSYKHVKILVYMLYKPTVGSRLHRLITTENIDCSIILIIPASNFIESAKEYLLSKHSNAIAQQDYAWKTK